MHGEDTDQGRWVHAETPAQTSFLHLGAGENNLELSTDAQLEGAVFLKRGGEPGPAARGWRARPGSARA